MRNSPRVLGPGEPTQQPTKQLSYLPRPNKEKNKLFSVVVASKVMNHQSDIKGKSAASSELLNGIDDSLLYDKSTHARILNFLVIYAQSRYDMSKPIT